MKEFKDLEKAIVEAVTEFMCICGLMEIDYTKQEIELPTLEPNRYMMYKINGVGVVSLIRDDKTWTYKVNNYFMDYVEEVEKNNTREEAVEKVITCLREGCFNTEQANPEKEKVEL